MGTPAKPVVVKLESTTGDLLSILTATAKNFKTGSEGLYANGRVSINGADYTVGVIITKVGSKPKASGK